MSTLRAIIVDDERMGIESLCLVIEKFVPGIRIVSQTTKASEAIDLIQNYKPEIVFLDINMPDMNGFEILDRLQWREFNLIFTTAHREYGLRALKNNAVDYLLKPVDHEDLSKALFRIRKRLDDEVERAERFNITRLLEMLNSSAKDRLLINLKAEVETLKVEEIILLESVSNYTRIYLEDAREILTSKTLKEFDQQLCDEGNPASPTNKRFMRIHNSFIINLAKVCRYLKTSESVVMKGDKKVPVSKSKKEAFYRWMNV
jgi:two-component system, LytTR family, response regulator